jgi:hypothetical protein
MDNSNIMPSEIEPVTIQLDNFMVTDGESVSIQQSNFMVTHSESMEIIEPSSCFESTMDYGCTEEVMQLFPKSNNKIISHKIRFEGKLIVRVFYGGRDANQLSPFKTALKQFEKVHPGLLDVEYMSVMDVKNDKVDRAKYRYIPS